MPTRREFIAGVAGLSLVSLAGCGGGSKSLAAGGGGRAVFTIHWPAPSRLIPNASQAVKVTVTRVDNTALTGVTVTPACPGISNCALVQRDPANQNQTSTITFTGLPVSRDGKPNIMFTATAQPSADGSGQAQAFGSQTLAISDTTPNTINITMNSTVRKIAVTPVTPPAHQVGDRLVLTATAFADEAQTMVVLTSPLKWQRGGAQTTVSVSPDGVPEDGAGTLLSRSPVTVHAFNSVDPGAITVSDPESGASTPVPIVFRRMVTGGGIDAGVAGSTVASDGGPNINQGLFTVIGGEHEVITGPFELAACTGAGSNFYGLHFDDAFEHHVLSVATYAFATPPPANYPFTQLGGDTANMNVEFFGVASPGDDTGDLGQRFHMACGTRGLNIGDSATGKIVRYDYSGAKLTNGQLSGTALTTLTDIDVRVNVIYVLSGSRVYMYNETSGAALGSVAVNTVGTPKAVAADDDGNIFVLSVSFINTTVVGASVQKFTATGGSTSVTLSFHDARDIAFENGLLNVLGNDSSGHVTVSRFITTGQQVGSPTPISGMAGMPAVDSHKLAAATIGGNRAVFALVNPGLWLIAQHTYDQVG